MMGQDHHHHDHGGHHHHHHGAGNLRALGIAAALTGGFMLAEVVGGVLSGSLALLADAGHMVTDFAALVLAFLALRLSQRPADARRTFGFDRVAVLAAFVNGLALFVIAGWIVVEAAQRLANPAPILGGLMFWVAVLGLIVNLVAFWILTRGETDNLNVRAAALHVAGDLLGSVAAIVASLVILQTGWLPIDPILSVLVALIILRSAWRVVRDSSHVLLEAVPADIDIAAMGAAIREAVPQVTAVDHVHAWSITPERPMVTMEVAIADPVQAIAVKERIKALLAERFNISHATVEVR